MFERIKAYKKLKKVNKFLRDLKMAAEMINDEELLEAIHNTMAENEILLKRIIFDRKTAEKYNLEMIRHGFDWVLKQGLFLFIFYAKITSPIMETNIKK